VHALLDLTVCHVFADADIHGNVTLFTMMTFWHKQELLSMTGKAIISINAEPNGPPDFTAVGTADLLGARRLLPIGVAPTHGSAARP
jgi:hypothetical protein